MSDEGRNPSPLEQSHRLALVDLDVAVFVPSVILGEFGGALVPVQDPEIGAGVPVLAECLLGG